MRIILSFIFILFALTFNAQNIKTDVLIIGGGASGTMAGIQAARMGVSVIITEETPWLGGMLTSAGVSAVDGNYRLHSGLWEEFRQKLNNYYGGEEHLKTGWVSNVLFEPQIGAKILSEMVSAEKNLNVYYETGLQTIQKQQEGWFVTVRNNKQTLSFNAKIVIDATELGDVAKTIGIPYDIGMDSRYDTGEAIAPEKANNIIQDLTYVAILKDYGKDADFTIEKPENYEPTPFLCTCAGICDQDSLGITLWDCDKMIQYGKLPNNYYMINWPINGNDYYLNLIDLKPVERKAQLEKAKNYTLQYLYYLQTELGFKNLGIADDVYPTEDGLPFIPYHRESRRIRGLVQFTVNDLARPFEQKTALYRTGVAVGDYPVDHHHKAYPEADKLPDLHFYPVPSYSLPLGTMIPKYTDNFIVAEKSISVTNLVNGTTRLQPVCLLIGQAAGTLAALSVRNNKTPKNIPVREVQKELLNTNAFLMPYSDVNKKRTSFQAIQRIGASGILKGEGKNIGWENHTHFYPDSILTAVTLKDGLNDWLPENQLNLDVEKITYKDVLIIIKNFARSYNIKSGEQTISDLNSKASIVLQQKDIAVPQLNALVTREVFSVLLDYFINPFELKDIDHLGKFVTSN